MKTKLLFITLLTLMIGCAKQGPQGPTGPGGATGATGSSGLPGPIGPQGTSGTANIKILFDSASPSNWTAKGSFYTFIAFVPYITNSDSAIVSVDAGLSLSAVANWDQLPFTNVFAMGDEMDFSYTDYSITLFYNYSSSPPQQVYFKITVTPAPKVKGR